MTRAIAEDEIPAGCAVAVLAAGCFWGVEEILREIPGVVATMVGYTGGTLANPGYRDVVGGDSGHTEAVRVVFDPQRIGYGEVLDTFFRLHDPTTVNRQGNDVGSQYRSAIFTYGDGQREAAEAAKQRASACGRWKQPVATQIVPATTFYAAEDYHQDYLQKNPNGYHCHFLRD